MKTIIKNLFDSSKRKLAYYEKRVEEINQLEQTMSRLTDEQLKEKTAQFKARLRDGERLEQIQTEAFAVVREASKRVIGLRHYDVQLIGGLVLSEGNIAEMPTGEGKTLVASLPSYLRALEGKGVHVITVNEYLARRDCELIGQIHEFLGLTVGLNVAGMSVAEKKAAYEADITYGIGNEFGFDYLRDKMSYEKNGQVQRPYHYALIDEVDSVLIDEAKTPLIIAGKTSVSADLHVLCARLVKSFTAGKDFHYDSLTKQVNLSDDGINKIEKAFGIDNLFDLEHQTLYHYIIQAVRARAMLRKDVDYIVKDGEIQLVDLFTGRVLEGRSYSDGLHQALEAKEGVQITKENKTQATITVQNYYRMYPILAGMTGTAKTEEREFQQVYGMDVFQVPTNKPKIRTDLEDYVYRTMEEKYQAVTEEVKRRHQKGQPVLVGTTSIENSEVVAEYFDEEGLPYQLLNAKSVEQEAHLIAQAGQKGRITIATNMAGRGTDILLGDGVAELGGLFVIGTERHESRRIDNQLRGRAGRQGDPGSSRFFVSLDDEIIVRYAKEEAEKLKDLPADETGRIVDEQVNKFIEQVQLICEGSNFAAREYTLKLDDAVNEQRNIIYQLREKVLVSENLLDLIEPMVKDSIRAKIAQHTGDDRLPEEWDIKRLVHDCKQLIATPEVKVSGFYEEREPLEREIFRALEAYMDVLENEVLKSAVVERLKPFLLSLIDRKWSMQLDAMTRLREGIGLRSYGQEDPMRVYQREALELFSKMHRELQWETSVQMAAIVRSYLAHKEQKVQST